LQRIGYGLDDRGSIPGRDEDTFSLSLRAQIDSGAHSSSIQWVPVALSPDVKRPGCEVDHSPTSGATIKKAWSYTSALPYVFMAYA